MRTGTLESFAIVPTCRPFGASGKTQRPNARVGHCWAGFKLPRSVHFSVRRPVQVGSSVQHLSGAYQRSCSPLQRLRYPVQESLLQHGRCCSIARRLLGAVALQGSSTEIGSASTQLLERDAIKQKLSSALNGVDRGIFGIQAAKQAAILDLLKELEELTSEQEPAHHLDRVEGCWRLLFSTIKIQGVRKTRLGLREVVSLGDFLQIIDTKQAAAINEVLFSLNLFGKLPGKLTINATYKAVSPCRVDVTFADARLEPKQLQELFASQLDVLLSIFNPEGWLDITYLDERHRIGRDHKGNIFYLERCSSNTT